MPPRRPTRAQRALRRGLYLFTRDRLYSRDSGKFAPWERKRGAVLELCRLLAGESTALCVRAGDAAKLRSTRYILTLDADTRLEPESARELIGAALHPLNRPAVDPKRGIVFAATACCIRASPCRSRARTGTISRASLPPRAAAIPTARTPGKCIWTPFKAAALPGRASSMWGAYLACLGERIPEGRVLSHDALEGAFLRGGYVSDVELTDGFPPVR